MAKEECTEAQQSKLPVVGDFRKKSNTEKERETFAVNFGEISGKFAEDSTSCNQLLATHAALHPQD